ncbi:Flp pilus assembly protein CpaB [Cumulibacter manganitolerans]|uniref:Flp pilus assembly protein CpaB n=1 Tax=Cumulibacter manganitolerans TaxID=1884992 RepID=UPI001295BFB5|nr:RcpC/CpaB family pilus assembly protein [Cumulibacter manganitolerans]
MNRRFIAAISAVVLAILGTFVLLKYVAGADQRAAAGTQTTTVLVVGDAAVPKGTSAADLAAHLVAKPLPVDAVAAGAMTTLDGLAGKVTTVDLQPGEQVLASRFEDPKSLVSPQQVAIPAGMQEVSILLDPQRVIGGIVKPGDHVAVYVTAGPETALALSKVLVSNVQGGVAPPPAQNASGGTAPASASAAASAPAPAAGPAPSGSVMLTFALAPTDAQKLIFSAEHASIWLALEPADG